MEDGEYDTSSIREENGRLVLVLSEDMAERIEEALGDKAKMNEVAIDIDTLLEQGGHAKDAKFADIRLEVGSPFMPGLLHLARQFIEPAVGPAAPAGGKRRHRKTQRGRKASKTRKH